MITVRRLTSSVFSLMALALFFASSAQAAGATGGIDSTSDPLIISANGTPLITLTGATKNVSFAGPIIEGNTTIDTQGFINMTGTAGLNITNTVFLNSGGLNLNNQAVYNTSGIALNSAPNLPGGPNYNTIFLDASSGDAVISGALYLGPVNAAGNRAAWFSTAGDLNMGYGNYWMTHDGVVGLQALVIGTRPTISGAVPLTGPGTADWFDANGNVNLANGNVAITPDGSITFGWFDGPSSSHQPATVSINATTGTLWASSSGTLSDMRFKTDVHKVESGLDTIMALKPVTYIWKDKSKNEALITNSEESARKFGFIAQDVEKVLPDLVHVVPVSMSHNGDKDALGLDYQGIIAPLVKAVQEQQVEIEALKAQLAQQH